VTAADAPVASSLSGYVVIYVILPLVVAAITGVWAGHRKWARIVNDRLNTQDTALAVMVQEIRPKGEKSLRELVTDNLTQSAVTAQRLTDHLVSTHRLGR
jgi:hypothetical protein